MFGNNNNYNKNSNFILNTNESYKSIYSFNSNINKTNFGNSSQFNLNENNSNNNISNNNSSNIGNFNSKIFNIPQNIPLNVKKLIK